jgi:hypothetical protein
MIYSGLEFGQYFEVERDTKCHNVLLALTPATRMAFTFIQMYFIFLNNEVRITKLPNNLRCHLNEFDVASFLSIIHGAAQKRAIIRTFFPEPWGLGTCYHLRKGGGHLEDVVFKK